MLQVPFRYNIATPAEARHSRNGYARTSLSLSRATGRRAEDEVGKVAVDYTGRQDPMRVTRSSNGNLALTWLQSQQQNQRKGASRDSAARPATFADPRLQHPLSTFSAQSRRAGGGRLHKSCHNWALGVSHQSFLDRPMSISSDTLSICSPTQQGLPSGHALRSGSDLGQQYSKILQARSSAAPTSSKRKYEKINEQMRQYALRRFGNSYGKKDVREVKGSGAVAMKMQLKISELQRNELVQAVAVKFWTLIVNLQYEDVRRLSYSREERGRAWGDKDIQHAALPVDMVTYQRVLPLLQRALGAIADPAFHPRQSDTKVEVMRGAETRGALLYGQVHFDRFVMDLGLMLGQHLLTLHMSDIAFIYRKCLHATTHRFEDNLQFVQQHQIVTPFTLDHIRRAGRQTSKVTAQPLGPAHTQRSVVKVLASPKDHSKQQTYPADLQHLELGSYERGPGSDEHQDCLPQPPHASSPGSARERGSAKRASQPAVGRSLLDVERADALPKRARRAGHSAQQRSRNAARGAAVSGLLPERRQKSFSGHIQKAQPGGVLVQLAGPATDSKSSRTDEPAGSDQEKQTHSEHRLGPDIGEGNEEGRACTHFQEDKGGLADPESRQQPTQRLLEVLPPAAPENLFDFQRFELDRRNQATARQLNLDAAKAHTAHLAPFDTGYEKVSCLEGLDDAVEFMMCAESRVAKTPGGLPRPVAKKHSFNAHVPHSKLKRIHTFMLSKPHRQYSNSNFRKAKAKGGEESGPQRHPSVLNALVPPAHQEHIHQVPAAQSLPHPLGLPGPSQAPRPPSSQPQEQLPEQARKLRMNQLNKESESYGEQASSSGVSSRYYLKKSQAGGSSARSYLEFSRRRTQIVLGTAACSSAVGPGNTYITNPAVSKIDSMTYQLEQEKVFDAIVNRNAILSEERFGDDALLRKMVSKLNPVCLPQPPKVVPQAEASGAVHLESDRLKRFPTQDYEQEQPSVDKSPSPDAVPADASPVAYIQTAKFERASPALEVTSQPQSKEQSNDVQHEYLQGGTEDEQVDDYGSAEKARSKAVSPFKTGAAPHQQIGWSGRIEDRQNTFKLSQSPSSWRTAGMGDESLPANATPVLPASGPLTPIYSDQDGNIIAVQRYSPPVIASIDRTDLEEIEGGRKKPAASKTKEEAGAGLLDVPPSTRIVPLTQLAQKRQSSVTARLGDDVSQNDQDRPVSRGILGEDYADARTPNNANIIVRSGRPYITSQLGDQHTRTSVTTDQSSSEPPGTGTENPHPPVGAKRGLPESDPDLRRTVQNNSPSQATQKHSALGSDCNLTLKPFQYSTQGDASQGPANTSQMSVRGRAVPKQEKDGRKKQLARMRKKSRQVFPFNEDLAADAQERQRVPSRERLSTKRRSRASNSKQHRSSSNVSPLLQSDTAASSQGVKESLYALRRANKTRRQHIQKTQVLRHEYLEASPIPGVDYGRSLQQTKTLFIPDEYMKRLAEGGFVVFGAQSVEGSAQEMPSVQDFASQADVEGKEYQVVSEANEAAEDAEEVPSSTRQSQQSSPNLLPIPPTSMYQLQRIASDDEVARQAGDDASARKGSAVCGRFLAHEARAPTRRVTVPKVTAKGPKSQMSLNQNQLQGQQPNSSSQARIPGITTQQTLGLPTVSNANFKSDVSTQEAVPLHEAHDYQQYMRMSSPQSRHHGSLRSYKIIPRSASQNSDLALDGEPVSSFKPTLQKQTPEK